MKISDKLNKWKADGLYLEYGPFRHKLFVKQLGEATASADQTLLLIHGFPESSYSYHAIVEGMMKHFKRIILFDMLGYGLSDKPTENYTYSIYEQADTVLAVWKYFGITGGHVLAHDMGDSVTTELLARHEQDLLPSWFSEGIKSITFTNGSMVLSLAKLRITQKLLVSRFGHLLKKIPTFRLFKQQVQSAHGNTNLSFEEIQTLWELNTLQDGHQKTYLTIKYLLDRKRFEESRWLPALKQTQLPIHICWGDDDAVAPVKIAHYLKENICKTATLTIMKGLGHFCQLGNPEKWVEHISAYYETNFFKLKQHS